MNIWLVPSGMTVMVVNWQWLCLLSTDCFLSSDYDRYIMAPTDYPIIQLEKNNHTKFPFLSFAGMKGPKFVLKFFWPSNFLSSLIPNCSNIWNVKRVKGANNCSMPSLNLLLFVLTNSQNQGLIASPLITGGKIRLIMLCPTVQIWQIGALLFQHQLRN